MPNLYLFELYTAAPGDVIVARGGLRADDAESLKEAHHETRVLFQREDKARRPAGAIILGLELDARGKSALDSMEVEMNTTARSTPWFSAELREIGAAEASRKNPGIRRRLTPGKKRVPSRRRR